MLHKSVEQLVEGLDVKDMSRLPLGVDHSPPNGSSIAFVLEHYGRQLLLLGDAHASDYEASYASSRQAHPTVGPPDVVKVSHHGSRNNTTARLATFGAPNYLVSTNGEHFGHPDDAALARLAIGAPQGRTPKFWFNYSTPKTRRWAELARTGSRFNVELPSVDSGPGTGTCLCELADS